MMQTIWYLIDTVASLLAVACLLRGYMNWLGQGARDPLGQFVVAATDWLVRPLRRMLPRPGRFDWGSVLAAVLIAFLLALLYLVMFGGGRIPMLGLALLLAAFWIVKWILYLIMGLVLFGAILSWVNPYAPIRPIVDALTRPFLMPLRRVIPLIGGVDLSPLVVLIIAQVMLSALHSALPSLFMLGHA